MNKYVEERCIGRGSYGCAYLATEIKTGKKYVVKKIPIELLTDKEKKQAFAEVELLAKLDNAYVVQYKENFVEGTVLHLVMEYCDGGDLTARIKEMKETSASYFPPDVVLTWFVQMAVAIKYLHQRHILHRDLKTSNIFLTRQSVVKLGDFGIARTLDSTMDHAKTMVGTPFYMSPEVCESKPYSYASDIWALGCVLYEVCTFKHAFDAPNILMLIVKIIQHEFPPLPSCYPAEFTSLLKALLNKDPDKRPSIDAILQLPMIQAHMQGMQSSAKDPPVPHLTDNERHDAGDPRGAGRGVTTPKKGHWTDDTVSYDYLSSSLQDDHVAAVIRPPSLVQGSPKMAGVDGKSRGGDRVCWVEPAASDEVEEALEGPVPSTSCEDELIKPNYETAYSEECFDSIHIDYGCKVGGGRRKALTLDHHVPLPPSRHPRTHHGSHSKHPGRPHVVGKPLQADGRSASRASLQLPPRHPETGRPPAPVKVVLKPNFTSSRRKSPVMSASLSSVSSLSPSSSIGDDDDSNGDGREVDDMEGPYTSMSECDAEENFYSDDSDFDNEDLTFDTSGELPSLAPPSQTTGGVGLGPGALLVGAPSPPVEHGYSDDFDDTEAEVIEYDNEEFATHNGSSSSSSDDGDDEGDDDAPIGDTIVQERRGLVESYSYDDEEFLQSSASASATAPDPPLAPLASVVAVGEP